MKRKIMRLAAIGMAVCLFGSAMTGCSNKNETNADEVTHLSPMK